MSSLQSSCAIFFTIGKGQFFVVSVFFVIFPIFISRIPLVKYKKRTIDVGKMYSLGLRILFSLNERLAHQLITC